MWRKLTFTHRISETPAKTKMGNKQMQQVQSNIPVDKNEWVITNPNFVAGRSTRELNLRLIAGQCPQPFNANFLKPMLKPLQDAARALSMRLFDVEGKGDCLYHSVFACLYVAEINDDHDGLALKARVIEYLQTPAQRDKLHMFVLGNEQMEYDRWIAALKRRALWPDSYVIHALAEICHVSIYVHTLNRANPLTVMHPREEDQELYKGEIHIANINNIHFIAMLPQFPKVPKKDDKGGAKGGTTGGGKGGAEGGAKGGLGAVRYDAGKNSLQFSDKHF